MYGYVMEGRQGNEERKQFLGAWFYCLTLPTGRGFSHIRRRKLWKKMYRAGVRRAVLPAALVDEAAGWGISAVEVHPLRRALLPQLLDCCPAQEGKTVRLTAPCVTAAVREAAEVLARRARYVDLQVGQGSEELAQYLQRRYGLAVGAVNAVVLTVRFDGGGIGRSIHLGEDCAAYETIVYDAPILGAEEIPAEEQLLAALLEGEYIKKEEIQVKSILFNA